jgi:hypothetical protein
MSVRDREEMVVARLQSLAPHLDGEPDPAFRAATRARLVAMAAVRTPEPEPVSAWRRLLTTAPAAPSRLRTRLTAGLAGAALTVTALATVVAVSTDARPGDALYGLKRGTEQTQLALAGDSRAETLLDFARTRLEEVRALDGDADLVVETLATMDEQTTEGAALLAERAVENGDEAPLDTLEEWAEVQSAGLADVRDDVPAGAEAAVDDSLGLLAEITTRSDGLHTALGCSDGPATLPADELGPVPGLCLPGGTGAPAPGETDPGLGTPPSAPGGTPGQPPAEGVDPQAPGTDGPGGGLLPPVVPNLPKPPPVTGETPSLPLPSLPLPSLPLPSLPLPGSPGGSGPDTSGGDEQRKPPLDISVCLPPLATLGDC